MTFSEALEQILKELGCSPKELSLASGVSRSAVGRYLSGTRRPGSGTLEKLASGLERIAAEQGRPEGAADLRQRLFQSLPGGELDFEGARQRLLLLRDTLGLSNAELARALSFDASMISRILSGKRTPGNGERFLRRAGAFLARQVLQRQALGETVALLGADPAALGEERALEAAILAWLAAGTARPQADPLDSFLRRLDTLELGEYIRAISFSELPLPELREIPETVRDYYGLGEMMQAELDFQQMTLAARETEPVLIYSDMPMEDMAGDRDFARRWMYGMAMLLRRGLRLNLIHNVDRPFNEMMLGLENYIPLYMTGLISPYYLKKSVTGPFRHLLEVSGAAALRGEAIEGRHGQGRYTLTTCPGEVEHYRRMAGDLLKKASPLMEILREDPEGRLPALLREDPEEGACRMILSSLPLGTLPETLLVEILTSQQLPEEARERVLRYGALQRELWQLMTQKGTLEAEVPDLSPEEFSAHPMRLDLSGLFPDRDILYSYGQYRAHLEMTLAAASERVRIRAVGPTFRNIQILIRRGRWALVSKGKAPAIHFLIRHPRMVSALAQFTPLITDPAPADAGR